MVSLGFFLLGLTLAAASSAALNSSPTDCGTPTLAANAGSCATALMKRICLFVVEGISHLCVFGENPSPCSSGHRILRIRSVPLRP